MKKPSTQITHGIRSILSMPFVYSLYQKMVFPKGKLVSEHIHPHQGQKILDIGCGTGDILAYLSGVDYLGIDASDKYIQTARKRYGHIGTFKCININETTLAYAENFDVALAIGVLHHISDDEALSLFKFARDALKPGGRFIAVEPCYVENQSFLAKWIISKDRGQNVKDKKGYLELSKQVFDNVNCHVRHDLLKIPFTMLVMECVV